MTLYLSWRQAGSLAAAGIYALSNIQSLEIDHKRTSIISHHLVSAGITLTKRCDTNMVWFDVSKFGTMDALAAIALRNGIKMNGGTSVGRIVLHGNIDDRAVYLFNKSIQEFISMNKS